MARTSACVSRRDRTCCRFHNNHTYGTVSNLAFSLDRTHGLVVKQRSTPSAVFDGLELMLEARMARWDSISFWWYGADSYSVRRCWLDIPFVFVRLQKEASISRLWLERVKRTCLFHSCAFVAFNRSRTNSKLSSHELRLRDSTCILDYV